MKRLSSLWLLLGSLAMVGVLFGADARGSEPDDPRQYQEVVKVDGILVADGRAMQLFTGSPNGARHYARVVNQYADRLKGKVDIYSLIVPTAQTFYLPESWVGKVREEPANISATYKLLDRSIHTVDVVGSLRGHEAENIYFRTDHHWTGLAAYYAYTEFCKVAGLRPIKLDPPTSGQSRPIAARSIATPKRPSSTVPTCSSIGCPPPMSKSSDCRATARNRRPACC